MNKIVFVVCVCEHKKVMRNFVHKFTNNMGKVFNVCFCVCRFFFVVVVLTLFRLCADAVDVVIVRGFEYLCSHTKRTKKKRKRFQPLLKNVRKKFRCDSTQQAEEDAAADADADDADDDGKEIWIKNKIYTNWKHIHTTKSTFHFDIFSSRVVRSFFRSLFPLFSEKCTNTLSHSHTGNAVMFSLCFAFYLFTCFHVCMCVVITSAINSTQIFSFCCKTFNLDLSDVFMCSLSLCVSPLARLTCSNTPKRAQAKSRTRKFCSAI